MNFRQLAILVSVLVCGPITIHAACMDPPRTAAKLTACVPQFNRLTLFQTGPITSTQISKFCNSPARTTEIQCVEQIFDECKLTNSLARDIVEKTFNLNAIRDAVTILCNDTQIFAEKQDCTDRIKDSVLSCVNSAISSYSSNLQSLQVQAIFKGDEWFREQVYELVCQLSSNLAVCLKSYGNNCGREIGDAYDALMAASTAPVCSTLSGITGAPWDQTVSTRPIIGSTPAMSDPSSTHVDCFNGPQVAAKLVACIPQFNSLTAFAKGPITATQLDNFCNSPARTTEIECAETIFDKCKQTNSKPGEIVKKILNLNAIKDAVKVVCKDTRAFAEKQGCIERHKDSVTTCVRSGRESYQSRLRYIKLFAEIYGNDWYQKQLYEALCKQFSELTVCLKPYGRNCGLEVGDVFDALVAASTPTACPVVPVITIAPKDQTTRSTRGVINPKPRTTRPFFRAKFRSSGTMHSANCILFLSPAFVIILNRKLSE